MTALLAEPDAEPIGAEDAGAERSSRPNQQGPRADSLVEGMTILLVLSVLQRFIGFARNVLVCRYLEPDELGRWNMAFNTLTLLAPFLVLGLPGTFGRYVEYFRQRGQLGTFLRRVTVATAAFGSCGLVLLVLARGQIAMFVFRDPGQVPLLITAIAAMVAVIAYNFFAQLIIAFRQPRALSVINFANSFLFAAIAVGFLVGTDWGAQGMVASYALACFISSGLALRVVLPQWRKIGNADTAMPLTSMWLKLLPFAAWLWINDFLSNSFDAIDRLMIVHLAAKDHTEAISLVGQYHSSRILGVLVIAFAGMLSSVFLPYLTHDWEAGRRRRVSQQINFAIKLMSLSLTFASVSVMFAAPVIFGAVMQGKYMAGLDVLPTTMTYCIWFGLLLVVQNYMWLMEKVRFASAAILAGLICNVTLNALLVPIWKLEGAVGATAISNLVTLSLALCFASKAGLRIGRGTMLAVALPASLTFGPTLAATLLLVGGLVVGKMGWLFSARERRQVKNLIESVIARGRAACSVFR